MLEDLASREEEETGFLICLLILLCIDFTDLQFLVF